MVKCSLCGTENPESEMYSVLNKGKTEYECVWEDECKKLRKEYQKQLHDKKMQELKDKYESGIDEEYLKEFDKEKQFDMKFNLKFEDLIESPTRLRDASIHYKHKDSDQIFTWSLSKKKWHINTATNLSLSMLGF